MVPDEQLFGQIKKFEGSKTLIVGIGNTLKGDDGAGPAVCRELRREKTSIEVIDAAAVPENYIQSIIKKTPQSLLIIDAADFDAAPGTISIFEPQQLNSIVISTHTLSPRLFIDMVRQAIDVDVCFIGIQPAQTDLGQPLSPPVAEAVRRLSRIVAAVFPPEKP